MKTILTQERLKELLTYNPVTGEFIRRVTVGNQVAGKVAGCIGSKGYVQITIDGRQLLSHRLAFLYMDGVIPKEVDHIDIDPSNNRWFNLRETDSIRNNANKSNNNIFVGVRWKRSHNCWESRGREYKGNAGKFLGHYSTHIAACYARWAYEQSVHI